MTAVGLVLIRPAKSSSHDFQSELPRIVMALGWLFAALGAGLTDRFLATSSPSKTGLGSEPSIGGVCASGKPGTGGADRVSMPPVYAVHYFRSTLAWSEHGPGMVRNRESWG